MSLNKITHFIFGASFVFILLTLITINAQAEERLLSQPIAHVTGAINPDSAHDIIAKQLKAIDSRDADLAYSLTTEGFHKKFDTAGEFLTHLRFYLPPVYNHGSYKFVSQHNTQRGLVQKIEMENRSGTPVTVIYRLKQQNSGKWLIDSFAILSLESEPI